LFLPSTAELHHDHGLAIDACTRRWTDAYGATHILVKNLTLVARYQGPLWWHGKIGKPDPAYWETKSKNRRQGPTWSAADGVNAPTDTLADTAASITQHVSMYSATSSSHNTSKQEPPGQRNQGRTTRAGLISKGGDACIMSTPSCLATLCMTQQWFPLLVSPTGNASLPHALSLHASGQANPNIHAPGLKNKSMPATMATRRETLEVQAGLKVLVIQVTYPVDCCVDIESTYSPEVRAS
jgi:hypothetical protein